MKSNNLTTTQLTMLGLMVGILLLMAYTPLGYLNIGPLAISFNVIPVAICAVVLGPTGGAIAGAIFGITSFLQCIGVGGTSAMGATLFSTARFWLLSRDLYHVFWMDSALGLFTEQCVKDERICILCSNRIFLSIFEYIILYDCVGRTFW